MSWQPAVCSLVGELLFSRSCDFLTHPWQQFKIIFGGLFVFNNNNSIKSPALFLCKKKKKNVVSLPVTHSSSKGRKRAVPSVGCSTEVFQELRLGAEVPGSHTGSSSADVCTAGGLGWKGKFPLNEDQVLPHHQRPLQVMSQGVGPGRLHQSRWRFIAICLRVLLESLAIPWWLSW